MNVAAYLRVSTEDQANGDRYDLETQKQDIIKYAAREGFEIEQWYEDPGISGSTLERPALQNLLGEASKGSFQAVLIAKMDRLARDLMAQLWIEKELLKAEVELISVAEPFRGQDATAQLFRQIIGAFAQFERARIIERLSAGREAKARQGGYSGGGAPLGYKASRGAKALQVDNEKVSTVRRVFELREEHPDWTLRQLAEALNNEGLTTTKGSHFHAMQVKRVLDRELLYRGGYRYGREATNKGMQKPILT